MRKTLLLIPAWYPTENDPFAGSFFKEQAEALAERYNIIVLKLHEDYTKGIRSKISVNKTREQEGLVEVDSYGPFPLWLAIWDKLYRSFAGRKERIDGVGMYHSPAFKRYQEKYMISVIVGLQELGLDWDVVYGMSAQHIASEASILASYSGKPFICSEHSPFPWPGACVENTEHDALEKADCFLAISNDKIRQVLLQNVKLKRISYIGNMLDESQFIYSPMPHDTTTILIVAAHSFFKNFDMFIESINKLCELTDNEFKVIIAGYNANKGYSKNAEELEDKIKNSRFADKCEMIEAVPRDEMNRLYNRVDAFVMTSIQEGQPIAAMEAACCGLPVFSTRCGGVEDYIDDSMGRIVALTDTDAMANNLADFIEGKVKFDANHIRNNMIARYGKKAYLDNFENIIDSLE